MMFPSHVLDRVREISSVCGEAIEEIAEWNCRHPDHPPKDPEGFIVQRWLALEAERLGNHEVHGDGHGRACHDAHVMLWRLHDDIGWTGENDPIEHYRQSMETPQT